MCNKVKISLTTMDLQISEIDFTQANELLGFNSDSDSELVMGGQPLTYLEEMISLPG